MTWNTHKTAIAALIVLLLLSGTTNGILIYALNHRQQPAPEIAAQTERTLPPTFDVALGDEGASEIKPVRTRASRGTLRIVNSGGEMVSTNGGDTFVVVDANGTNSISLTPGTRGARRVMSYRTTGTPGRSEAGAGIGGSIGGGAPASDSTPARTPQ